MDIDRGLAWPAGNLLRNLKSCGTVMSMNSWVKEDILRLSIPERIRLVEDIWDSIADAPEELPLSAAQTAELDRRLDAHRKGPDEGASWDVVRNRIQNRK